MSADKKPGAQPLHLIYEWSGGPQLAPGLTERYRRLEIDAAAERVRYQQHRSESDGPGEPVGRFEADMPADLPGKVQALLTDLGVEQMREGRGGGPGTSLMRLLVMAGPLHIDKQVPSMDIELLTKLRPLIDVLEQARMVALRKPVQALRLDVAYLPGPKPAFELRFVNLGATPIVLTTPNTLTAEDPARRAFVQVSVFPEEVPGVTAPPLEWKVVQLLPSETGEEAVVVVPGGSWSARTVAFEPSDAKVRHLVQGVWADYVGDGAAAQNRRFRGAAFSDGLEVIPGS